MRGGLENYYRYLPNLLYVIEQYFLYMINTNVIREYYLALTILSIHYNLIRRKVAVCYLIINKKDKLFFGRMSRNYYVASIKLDLNLWKRYNDLIF